MQNYEPDVSQIIALYQQLEDDIITDMVRRMLKMGFVSESTAYQAEVLQTAGLLYDDIIAMIAQRTDASVEQVKALFEDAGVQTVEIDNGIHEEAGEAPVDIRQDAGMKQVLETGYKKTLGTMKNLVSTTASTTQKAFIAACDRAYMQVSSGAFSYQQAIRMAVKNLADSGAYVTYPTGHRDRIDVAVRRCVLTGAGQTAAAVAKKRAEDSGCDYMELTAHSGARPDHAKWQGQLVRIRGDSKEKTIDGLKVFTLHEIGYGKGDGFKGWNCRHNWHPYYPGLSTPNYTQEQLKKLDEKSVPYNGKKYTEYEISQMQRTAEQKIRALKRRTLAAQTAVENAPDEDTRMVLQTEYMTTAAKLKDSERILNDFCQQTGRRRDTFREQVNGFGRSEAQKAVHAAKRKQNTVDVTSGKNGGHAVEVTPLAQKDNGGTGKSYQAERITEKPLTFGVDSGIIREIHKSKNEKSSSYSGNSNTSHQKFGSDLFPDDKRDELYRDERIISGNKYETAVLRSADGKRLFQKKGKSDSVSFTSEEIKKMDGGVLTHNHPNGSVPSPKDINMIRVGNLAEIRACNSYGTYVIRRKGDWNQELNSYEKIESAYYDAMEEAGNYYKEKAAKEGKIILEYLDDIDEMALDAFCKRYDLIFDWEDKK